MIEIKNTKVFGLEDSMVRSGYPHSVGQPLDLDGVLQLEGSTDRKRSMYLGHAETGSGHDCFLKGILVTFDIKYSLYFTKQLQRYHFIDFISSQSTMHSITKMDIEVSYNKYVESKVIEVVKYWVDLYNKFDEIAVEQKDCPIDSFMKEAFNMEKPKVIKYVKYNEGEELLTKYDIYMKIISNLPAGFEYWAGMTTNYLQLKTIYKQRKNHKLKEDWGYFCHWIEGLPMFKELVLGEKNEQGNKKQK